MYIPVGFDSFGDHLSFLFLYHFRGGGRGGRGVAWRSSPWLKYSNRIMRWARGFGWGGEGGNAKIVQGGKLEKRIE